MGIEFDDDMQPKGVLVFLSNWLCRLCRIRAIFQVYVVLAISVLGFELPAISAQSVEVCVSAGNNGPVVPSRFLGLSYEISKLLPENGRYYFDPQDQALVNLFKTLGVKSLRVGANAVDDPQFPVPQEKDIDEFFNFARAAGVKVIYSFRLKNGDPSESARLAAYIADHDSDVLDCFSIGNEPNFYTKTFDQFYAQWKPQYDAILKAVPNAKFDGPSVANHPPAAQNFYPLQLARLLAAGGHLAMISDHYYFLGRRNDVEKNPAESRARFLSNDVDATYSNAYAEIGAKLAAQGIPYRIDEVNNCARGGARGSSDTYASALWALDCTHWWASHHILGMNYHTGESLSDDGTFNAPDYSAFVHLPDGKGFVIRPQAYAYLAFSQGVHGEPLAVNVKTAPSFNFNAYAYRNSDGSTYITLINKSYGKESQPAGVAIQLSQKPEPGVWRRMDLVQSNQDVAAQTGFALGDGEINSQGMWSGHWSKIKNQDCCNLSIQVGPASATLLHFSRNEIKPVAESGMASKQEQ
jgi:hypothetical protein